MTELKYNRSPMNPIPKAFLLILILQFFLISPTLAQILSLNGLEEEVEVFKDDSGINHIFAKNEHDLFFSQGYLAAKDRLFQFEIWRRRATGTVAEILGPRELERDKGARLFQFRGDKKTELSHYHPRGEQIVDAFVAGVNSYITEVLEEPEKLPIEFKLLDILPGYWTWDVVISRHQGLLQNVQDELRYSRVVSLAGAEKAKELYYFHPNEPILDIPTSIPKELLFKDILAPYNAFRAGLVFEPEDIKLGKRNSNLAFLSEKEKASKELLETLEFEKFSIGSNNWIISGKYTESGFPFMANDPHRLHAIPSLRYWVHLNAPGWNVVGGGEPVIPGVSIGHNEFGAWGLTIFETDNEDLRVYDINPKNPYQYRYKKNWMDMIAIKDTIKVKGQADEIHTHYYTIHGPVTFIDRELNKAVAMECAWLKPGGAPYLASLRMDQSQTWEEFRDACTYNHIPAENMIWADKKGNIGWQATGITPLRQNFSGLVVSLGDGSMDWEGYLPIGERPHQLNPEEGYLATANENVTPSDYPYKNALGYEWADAFRGDRIREVLAQGKKFTMKEMGELQNDYLALPARKLVPYLTAMSFEDPALETAKNLLKNWDFKLEKNSIPASIYVMWERKLRQNVSKAMVPEEVKELVGSIQLTRVIEWIEKPEKVFGENPKEKVEILLQSSLEETLKELEKKLGPDQSKWQYGQTAYKHALFRHPLSLALAEEWRPILDAGPLPRGGYSFTPAANAYGDNNSSGASFRIIVDTGNWERTMGINTPGQSGNPASPYYKNLFPIWANDGYFIVPFSYENIQQRTVENIKLKPLP
ncbi:penicillin acylase family protein [Shivajiella indica]|uniref:Penicillin acylase family protein n=1 Tax=Shivajiella indica TaxID=872115 RepID=A0ABW5BA46_9BACT